MPACLLSPPSLALACMRGGDQGRSGEVRGGQGRSGEIRGEGGVGLHERGGRRQRSGEISSQRAGRGQCGVSEIYRRSTTSATREARQRRTEGSRRGWP